MPTLIDPARVAEITREIERNRTSNFELAGETPPPNCKIVYVVLRVGVAGELDEPIVHPKGHDSYGEAIEDILERFKLGANATYRIDTYFKPANS